MKGNLHVDSANQTGNILMACYTEWDASKFFIAARFRLHFDVDGPDQREYRLTQIPKPSNGVVALVFEPAITKPGLPGSAPIEFL